MQSMVLIAVLVATFIWGFLVVRALGQFFDENYLSQETDADHTYLTDEVEKQDGK